MLNTLWFNQVNGAPFEIQWLPNYQILKEALESYGFRINSSQDAEIPEAGEFPCCLPFVFFFVIDLSNH